MIGGYQNTNQVDEYLNPKPIINSRTCQSSHGNGGFLEGTTFDSSLGAYVCPCGRQYFSDIPRPEEVNTKPSYTNDILQTQIQQKVQDLPDDGKASVLPKPDMELHLLRPGLPRDTTGRP